MNGTPQTAARHDVDYRITDGRLPGEKPAAATCFACGKSRINCSMMIGSTGSEVVEFPVCHACTDSTLAMLAAWVTRDPGSRWLTLGAARTWAHGKRVRR